METGEDVTEIFAEIASNQKRHPHRLRYSSRCLICEIFKKMKHDDFLFLRRSLVCDEVVGSPDQVLFGLARNGRYKLENCSMLFRFF